MYITHITDFPTNQKISNKSIDINRFHITVLYLLCRTDFIISPVINHISPVIITVVPRSHRITSHIWRLPELGAPQNHPF